MTDPTHDDDDPADYDLEAAEYVVGTLSPDRSRALEELAAQNPDVAAAILAWQERLCPLVDMLPRVTAPATAWPRLERAITPRQPLLQVPPIRLKLRVRVWRGLATNFAPGFVGAVCGMALMGLIVMPKMLISLPAVAALQATDTAAPAYLIMLTKDGRATIIANNVTVPSGRSFQLWGLPEGTTVPISLGVLPASGMLKMPAIVGAGTVLLVTSEMPGGSTSGMPTTTPLYTGKLIRG